MTSRPLPKTLKAACETKFADRFEEGWTEYDGFSDSGWTHWVYLKPGWRNAWLDPCAALHAIHEPTTRECLVQLRHAEPCNCEECSQTK